MSLKLLTQLSHFITMIFGVAFVCHYAFFTNTVNLFISDLSPLIVGITFLGIVRGFILILFGIIKSINLMTF